MLPPKPPASHRHPGQLHGGGLHESGWGARDHRRRRQEPQPLRHQGHPGLEGKTVEVQTTEVINSRAQKVTASSAPTAATRKPSGTTPASSAATTATPTWWHRPAPAMPAALHAARRTPATPPTRPMPTRSRRRSPPPSASSGHSHDPRSAFCVPRGHHEWPAKPVPPWSLKDAPAGQTQPTRQRSNSSGGSGYGRPTLHRRPRHARQHGGAATISQNIANANTPGYSRQSARD